MTKTIVVVYHVKTPSTLCFDGFCAATIMWRRFGDQAVYKPALYHDTPDIEYYRGKDVYFVDFSFDVETMDKINDVAHSLMVFDHHMPKAASFSGRDYAKFSATESGCVMAWKYIHAGDELPTMVELVDDGDRYLNKHAEIKAFMAALAVEEQSFRHWSYLIDTLKADSDALQKFIRRGETIEQYNDARIATLVKDSFPITLCGVKGLAVNSNKFYSHLAGIELAKQCGTYGAVFYVRQDGYVETSLRRVDPNIDVEQIAKTFGGGGHKGAAGFSVSLDKFKELMTPINATAEMYARLDTVTRSFAQTLDKIQYIDIPHIQETFLQHLQGELGSFIADDLEFSIIETAGHPGYFTRVLSDLAQAIGLPTVSSEKRWYHKVFPYAVKQELTFDEDQICGLLMECKTGDPSLNSFLAGKLLETVKSGYKAELRTSVYYIHVSVKVPSSKLTVRHTFEVFK